MDIMSALQKIQTCLQSGENFVPKPLPTLPVVVEEARQEWLNAQCYYNTVSDEDLIDHAVYLMFMISEVLLKMESKAQPMQQVSLAK